MKAKLWPTAPAEQREQLLKDQCDGTELVEYLAELTKEDLIERREKAADNGIALQKLEERKAQFLKELKEEAKPLKEEQRALLKSINLKGEERVEVLYKFVDQENSEVGYYDKKGKLVQERRARPEERQLSFKIVNQDS
tara:strand:- start:10772 stop:11188 length:417 start_codon:yes stop_codon:yes gene_type:complete